MILKVKIMWPRGDAPGGPGADITETRRAKSAGLSGFVSYLKRKDAEEAVRSMDGFDWGGFVLRVGWSKAVPVSPIVKYGWSAFSYSILSLLHT
jgi:U2-associated protein SR140